MFLHKLSSVPNDPLFANQWNLSRIDINNAWEITKGNNDIIIAIIDVGADYNHDDLIDNRWGLTGGYDFIGNDNDPYPYDGARHGTAVAGIIAAASNNGLGISGVAGGWNSQGGVKLMHLRAGYIWLNGEVIDFSAAAEAIEWAAENGAQVVNMSFGWKTNYTIIKTAINNAFNEHGVIFVGAAGNYFTDDSPEDHWILFPANCNTCEGLINIGASIENDYRKELTDGTDEPWWGSCYGGDGRILDLIAPGIHIPTTDITGAGGYVPEDYYLNFNGTSASAPLLSGLVGLMLSVNSSLNYDDIYDIITNTADKVSGMGGQNYHDEYGYGRIDAYNALKYTLENYGGTLTQNLTIPVGETWNFNVPGVQVTLENGASIIVEGTLNVQGSSSNKITFTRSGSSDTWGSIIFDGSSTSGSIIDYANIMYASEIQCLNGADVTIQNSLIKDCTQGIYIYNSQPQILNNQIIEPINNGIYGETSGKRPLIQGNEITKSTNNQQYKQFQGILFGNSSKPFITNNDVGGFYHAIYLGGGTVSSSQTILM